MTKAADLKGILEINEKPLVSKDFNHFSNITQTQVIKGKVLDFLGMIMILECVIAIQISLI